MLVVVPGDGIGPAVMRQTLRIVEWFAAHRGLDCDIHHELYGAETYLSTGRWARDGIFEELAGADAILFGGLGGAGTAAGIPIETRRQWGMLRMRRELGLYANIRRIKAREALLAISPLRPEIAHGTDLVFVREIGGGLYNGEPRGNQTMPDGQRKAFNALSYTTSEIHRIARVAFEIARARGYGITSVDKANALETGMLWRQEVQAFRDAFYANVPLRHIYVDNCATELVSNPKQFGVLLTDNMGGDILSDCAAPIAGSLGMLPSASFSAPDGEGHRRALYEPLDVYGAGNSDPEAVNPIGAILSFALALEHSFGLPREAGLLDLAVDEALAAGARTADIACNRRDAVSAGGMTDAVLAGLARLQGPMMLPLT